MAFAFESLSMASMQSAMTSCLLFITSCCKKDPRASEGSVASVLFQMTPHDQKVFVRLLQVRSIGERAILVAACSEIPCANSVRRESGDFSKISSKSFFDFAKSPDM